MDRSVAELVDIASERLHDDVLNPRNAQEILGRYGIRGDEEAMTISISHNSVGEILKGTAWSKNWARILRRIPGATTTPNPIRFQSTRSRGILIPHQEDCAPKAAEYAQVEEFV